MLNYGFITHYTWENDRKMPLEFHLDKWGSPIPTWTNMGQSPICPNEMLVKCLFCPSLLENKW